MQIQGKTIAILIAPRGTEEPEFAKPKEAIEGAGGKIVVVSLKTGDAETFNNDLDPGRTFSIDKAIGDVSADEFDGLVIPGGCVGADKLRGSKDIVAFVKAFFEAGKPVAAICHAPWTLVEAGVLADRTLTSFPTLETDIRNAGGTWVDKEVSIDGNLITSRTPDDLPAFCEALIDKLAEQEASA
jgi:protease I